MKQRIGIYSGTFNPVHAGHISFALQALSDARLDKIYFMPERYRKHKVDVAHFAHRIAMIRQAIRPYRRFGLIENSDVSFSVSKTLPKLKQRFRGDHLVFLMGSDSLETLAKWPNVDRLLNSGDLVIGIRGGDTNKVKTWLEELPIKPKRVFLVDSYKPAVSSTKIREALRKDEEIEGILLSVRRYSNRNWLYISLA